MLSSSSCVPSAFALSARSFRGRRFRGHPVAQEGPAVVERESLGGRDRQCTDRPTVVRVLQVRILTTARSTILDGLTNVLLGVAALLVGVFARGSRALVREEIPISGTCDGEDRQHQGRNGAPFSEPRRGRSVRGGSRRWSRRGYRCGGGMRADRFGDVLRCGRWLM